MMRVLPSPSSLRRAVAAFLVTGAALGAFQQLSAQGLGGHNSNAPVSYSAYRCELQDRRDRCVRAGKGDVVAEARGSAENKRLCAAVQHFYDRGTGYIRAEGVQERLTSKHLKIMHKHENVTGLQIADLVAHPSYVYAKHVFLGEPVAQNFGGQLAAVLGRSKYHRSAGGRVRGYGLKWLP